MNLLAVFDKILPVLLAGLFFGAGLPALYAVGMRLLSGPTKHKASGKLVEVRPASVVARVIAYIIFVAIAGMVLLGILWIAKDFIHYTTGFNLFGAAG